MEISFAWLQMVTNVGIKNLVDLKNSGKLWRSNTINNDSNRIRSIWRPFVKLAPVLIFDEDFFRKEKTVGDVEAEL